MVINDMKGFPSFSGEAVECQDGLAAGFECGNIEITSYMNMKDLGANSLDIVEVVSCSMRELKVKVPRSELNTLENINQLVDLLHKTVEEKAAAAG